MPRPGDPFNFRPARDPSLSSLARTRLAREAGPSLSLGEPRAAQPSRLDASQPEISLDFVEESIKKLADALNVATDTTGRAGAPSDGAENTDAMLGRSVEALQTTARAMRARPGEMPLAPPAQPEGVAGQIPEWWPTPDPSSGDEPAPGAPPQLDPRLARIAEAVAAERMEILLEPIHALVEGRPRHFEVSMRLLTADGVSLGQGDYARAARGSGLMPRIDAAKMIRAARIAGRLGQRGREGSVLANVAGDSLTDQAFIEAASAGSGKPSPMSLVLSFAQSEVRAFTPGHARTLANLAALGLRFALQDVTDLDMDFAGLKGMGFAFVELDAPVFLEGLPAPGGVVPASDICRHLADFGLSLIVGRIEDDWLLARILGFGVMFGKGALFGGPRLVKDEVVAGTSAA
jgi:cyclic-di-GMP phosphodiesterase TipF (flagellum assembly factor)